MAEGVNQHYVPQFYFRYFSCDGKSICLLLRDSGHIVQKASIKGQASEKFFYGPSETEKGFKQLDTIVSKGLIQIRESREISECSSEALHLLRQHLMLQKARTLRARISAKPMMDGLIQLHLEAAINNDEKLSEEEREELLTIVPNVASNPEHNQGEEIKIAVEMATSIADLLPLMLLNKTRRPFIFSDAPVVLTNPFASRVRNRGVLGAESPGLMIFYPLASDRLVLLLDRNIYRLSKRSGTTIAVRDLRDVVAINKLQVHNAVKSIYFSDHRYSQYVYELWRQERHNLQTAESRIVNGMAFDTQGNEQGEIVHSFQPQLPYTPRLSFISHPVIDENDYRFMRRSDWRA